jgi:peptide/nickel transport system substrate-binding protein
MGPGHDDLPAAFVRARRLAALCLLSLSVLACSRAGPPSPPRTQSQGPLAYPAGDYIEHDRGVAGGVLRVTTALDPGTLDFQITTQTNAKWLGRLIYDNLVYLDNKGAITPWLATSWDVSPDGKTYTFHLRHDVTFSDGAPFDAEAVRANLQRMRDPATKAAMTTAYIAPYVNGVVKDRYTFEAHLSEPYAPFLNVLAQSWLGMMSPKALKEHPKDLGDHPVGSGPFVVAGYARQQSMTFARRPDYHWAPDFVRHAGPAYLDRVEVTFMPEALARYASLVAHQYDFTIDAPPQYAAALRADPDVVVMSRVNLGNPYRAITFNTTTAPFNDVRVRQAFAHIVDRDAITRLVGFGEFRPTAAFLSATTPFYDPDPSARLAYDPGAANRILDADGWSGRDGQGFRTKNGRRLAAEVVVSETAASGPVLIALQSDARKVGFDLQIHQVTTPQLVQRRGQNAYQALGPGIWHTNTPDGLYIVYHCRQISTPKFSGQNVSRLCDPTLDNLLSKARAASDPKVQQPLYRAAQERLTDLLPAVPLYENHSLMAYRHEVKGVVYDTSHNTPFFTTAWLAP